MSGCHPLPRLPEPQPPLPRAAEPPTLCPAGAAGAGGVHVCMAPQSETHWFGTGICSSSLPQMQLKNRA